jgi:regulator of replication initiation timing
MSEENNVTQTTEDTQDNNNSTQADTKNVPYDRFSEVNNAKNDALSQVGKLQAQIDKMNSENKSKAEAKLVEDGKLKEALDLMTNERNDFKKESLMSKLTEDDDKSIAEGLSLDKLEKYVTKVTNVSTPSTSSARAATGKAGDMGGYSSYTEWASKDPEGYQKATRKAPNSGINIGIE